MSFNQSEQGLQRTTRPKTTFVSPPGINQGLINNVIKQASRDLVCTSYEGTVGSLQQGIDVSVVLKKVISVSDVNLGIDME